MGRLIDLLLEGLLLLGVVPDAEEGADQALPVVCHALPFQYIALRRTGGGDLLLAYALLIVIPEQRPQTVRRRLKVVRLHPGQLDALPVGPDAYPAGVKKE